MNISSINFDDIEVLEIEEFEPSIDSIPKPPDFNEPDKKNNNKRKIILIILILILIVFIGGGLYYFLKYAKENVNSSELETKVVELGTKKEDIKINGCKLNLDKVDFNKIGKYTYTAKCDKKSYTVSIEIVDTTKPELELKILNLKPNQTFMAEDFVLSSNDLSNVKIKFEDTNINNTIEENGVYILPIIAKDESGNTTKNQGILLVTNVVADKFLSASKVESTSYNATLKVTDKIGFNSSNYYISAIRIYDYTFNSKEEYLKIKEESLKNNMINNIDGKITYDDDTLNIKLIKLLTKQELDILNGNFPFVSDEVSRLYSNLGYTNKVEFN